MLTSPLPSWRQLFAHTLSNDGYWNRDIFTSKSAVSIRLIVQGCREVLKKSDITLAVPEYFCAETEEEYRDDNLQIIRYPITKYFDPEWDAVKELFSGEKKRHIDLFLFVHYFGQYHDLNRARTFCDNNQTILIEDCAHALYDYGKVGQKGDFVLFSPHKLIPIPDGAIIRCNENKKNPDVALIYESIKQSLNKNQKANNSEIIRWKLKKVVQKLIRLNRYSPYKREEHFLKGSFNKTDSIVISEYSKKILSSLSYEDLKEITYRRRENVSLINWIVNQVSPEVIPLVSEQNDSPFFAAFSLEKVANPDEVISHLENMGFKILFWPTLPADIEILSESNLSRRLSRDLFAIPCHQGINPQELAKIAGKVKNIQRNEIHRLSALSSNLALRAATEADRKIWDELTSEAVLSVATQDWTYGGSKEQAEGWRVKRFIISESNEDIGVVQLLEKRKAGFTLATRVSRGPVFKSDKASIQNELAVMKLLRNEYHHPVLWSYVPSTLMNPGDYIKVVLDGWHNWDIHGFPSGIIDISESEEKFRAGLNSKWRNQLKSAEKADIVVRDGKDRFEEILVLYEDEQKEKGFQGVTTPLLKAMEKANPSPLRVFFAEDKDHSIMAYDIFYLHVNSATYYVGWNSEGGRRHNLNNLLLYKAAVAFHNEGMKYLDLGGIEYIHTEEIAKFKDGMNPEHYRTMGEFIRFR